MKLRHHDLDIPDKKGSDPFENCKLDRKKYADVLTDIVDGYADGFVLAINNPWGEGKTTFVKMWRQHLINEEFSTLYFNAWENDFQQDVLVALISELSELKNKPEQQFKDVLKKVVPLTGRILPSIIKHLIKRYGGDDAAQDIAEAFGEYTEDKLKEITDSYKEKKESIKKFRDSLEAFAIKAGGDKPLVFIIDELDRCRPNYAVEILEQIKHLFSVPGIVFVLSIDKEQLGHAVRGVYGSDNLNANEYLRRFIDLEYSIPRANARELCEYFYHYFQIEEFFNSLERKASRLNEEQNFIEFSESLLQNHEITIRQTEKLFAFTRLGLNSFKKTEFVFPRVYFFLIYLKFFHLKLYNNIKLKKYTAQELLEITEDINQINFSDERERESYIFTSVVLAQVYHNFLYENRMRPFELFDSNNQSDEHIVNIKSKYDTSEDNKITTNSFLTFRRLCSLYTFNINHWIKRIDLLESINV